MPVTPADRLFRHVRPGFLAALLLAWFWAQVITVSPELGITADEVIHVTAGYEYWTRGDYRLQPENGNLPQRLAALPLLALRPKQVAANNDTIVRADTWGVGNLFYFHAGNQPGLMTFLARVMISLVGVAAGVLVYLWSRSLWGATGALLSLAVFANSPTVLAHAGLATSDMLAAFAFLASTLAGWRLLHRVTVGRTLAFGVALGTLALAKFSAPLMVFIYAGLVALRLSRRVPLPVQLVGGRRRCQGWRRVPVLLGATVGAAALAWVMIWGAYGFRYLPNRDGSESVYPIKWEYLLGQTPFTMQTPVPPEIESVYGVPVKRDTVRVVAEWAREHRVLPESYLFGFLHVYTYSKWRPSFFLGEYNTRGWTAFFPVSVLLKTPLALLVLGLLAGVLLLRLSKQVPESASRAGQRPDLPRSSPTKRLLYRLGPLLVFAGIYGVFALTSSLNIGIRHLLPLDCALAVLAGVLVFAVRRRTAAAVAIGALFVAANVATWNTRPSYLAFFNSLAGGPNEGYVYLVDSSLDWGQGLPRLSAWLAENQKGQRVYLSYFGSDSPYYEALRVLRTGDGYFNREQILTPIQLKPGLFVVSATLLQGVYTMAPGPWTDAYEQAYQRRLAEVMRPNGKTSGDQFWFEFDQLRFRRLCQYLHTQKPIARPDPSLLVYRLGPAELSEALGYRVQ